MLKMRWNYLKILINIIKKMPRNTNRIQKNETSVKLIKKMDMVSDAYNNTDSDNEKIKLADMLINLMNRYNEQKNEIYDLRTKDNVQLQIMNKSKQIIEDLRRKNKILEKNKTSELENNEELLSACNNINRDVSETYKRSCEQKYNTYLEEWLSSIEDGDRKKNSKRTSKK